MAKRLPRIAIARAYDVGDEDHRYRVLVDRLWPRGISKQELHLDEWLKEVAPSTELRRWFNHQPERWNEFRKRYKKELTANAADVEKLLTLAKKQPLTLIYGARDEEHNDAVVLQEVLTARLRRKPTPKKSAK
jgi:uncharacterized protein YeaO (DUF488 family)